MKKFAFPFDKLLLKKKQEIEKIQKEMAPLVKKYNDFRQNQQEATASLKELKNNFSQEKDFRYSLSQQSTANTILQKLNVVLAKTKEELTPWQTILQKKNAEKKALEIIREKRYQDWKKLKDKQENDLLEEMFVRYQ